MKEFLAKVGTGITRCATKSKFLLKKHSPEILLVAGGISIVGGVILACKETLKLEEILDKHEETMNAIEDAHIVRPDDYTDEMVRHDKVVAMARVTKDVVFLYAPAASAITLGIGCMVGAYGIMKKRNVALIAAYKALESQFEAYRKRVIEKDGEETDRMYMNGLTKAESDVEGTDIKKGDLIEAEGHEKSMYARFFDESNPHYVKDTDENLTFIMAQEATANRMLKRRGVIVLNDVYDLLGYPRTTAGAHVGWALKEYGGKDGYVDFCIHRVWSDPKHENARARFMEGYEKSILLDFNVDGLVIDKFDKVSKGVDAAYALA